MSKRLFLATAAAMVAFTVGAEQLAVVDGNSLVTDDEPLVFGTMVSNKAWTTDAQRNAGLGLYRFYGSKVDARPVILNPDFQIESAAYKNGSYYIFSTANADTDAGLFGHLIMYDPEIAISDEIASVTSYRSLAGSLAYDPAGDKMYGFFANEWTESYTEFGSIDENTGVVTAIRSYFDDVITMAALAFDRNGQGYALDVKGELYRIDKSTGALSKVGFTGVTPRYSQSMSFDYRTGKLYWFGSAVDNSMRLYEINLGTAKATVVSADSQAQFLGIYMENPVYAAPDWVTDLSYVSSNARREGTLSFRMPERTFGGTALSGALDVRVAIEGVDTITVDGKSPGEQVSIPLTLPGGIARIAVTAGNDIGYGLPARVKTMVGVDKPCRVEDVVLRRDGDTATLSWTAPQAGENGGSVGDLKYRVVRNDDVVIAESTSATSLSGLAAGAYSLTNYTVTAFNEVGESGSVTSNNVILGEAQAMPFKESFDGGHGQYVWYDKPAYWTVSASGNNPDVADVDGSGGLASFCCFSTNVPKGAESMFVSPAVAIKGQQAYFNFSVYHCSGTFVTEDSLTPCVIAVDGTIQELGVPILRDNGSTGWREYSYPISGDVVCVALKGRSDYGYNIHVDRITVTAQQGSVPTAVADDLVSVYNLGGIQVARNIRRSAVSALAPGCYIVKSAVAVEKIFVK